MPQLDSAMADRIITRLGTLEEDCQPQWGKMCRDEMFGHMNGALRYSMGEAPFEMPFKGTWATKTFFKPLVVNQIVAIPKGVKLPRPKGMKEQPPPQRASLGQLHQTLKDYLSRRASGNMPATMMHPFFGPLTPNEWAKFHVAHFKHHMRQFNCW